MAFTTEFVMGAGSGGYDSLNFYWEDGGGNSTSPKVTVVATVDAGEGALVRVSGSLIQGSTFANQIPHVEIGDTIFAPTPAEMLYGLVAEASGSVEVRCLSRISNTSSLAGHVSVIRYTPPARYVASDSGEGPIIAPLSEWYTLSQHTVTSSGEGRVMFEVVRQNGLLTGTARFRVNDTPVALRTAATSPLTSEGTVAVEPGDVLILEVFMSASSDIYRRVNSWSWSLS